MSQIRVIHPADGLSEELATSIFDLMKVVWPPKNPATASTLAQSLKEWQDRNTTYCVLIGNDESSEFPAKVLAHASIFKREMFTQAGPLLVGALASVCVHPDYRGHGWGADVVRAAFGAMPELGTPVSLFQTPVPQFYEKLGCRAVENRFFNGLTPDNTASPFWDSPQMIYPASFPWPTGDIDINGEAF